MNRLLQVLAKRPVLITIVVCAALFLMTGLTSDKPSSFFNGYTFVNLFQNNAALGMVAVGMTLVILTGNGGIDLSVGASVGWAGLMAATLISLAGPGQAAWFHGWNPIVAMLTVLATATLIGALVGAMIHYLEIPAFLITLAFLFLYRGWALVVSPDEVHAVDPLVTNLSNEVFNLHGIDTIPVPVYVGTLVLLGIVGIGAFLGRYTGFGRSLYAIGGSETSALLMGLPVARSKVLVYALSGFCASLGGLVYFTKTGSGWAWTARGTELDAIAVAVMGGTLLTGGVGGVPGTLIGLITYAVIQSAMSRHSFPTGVDRMVIGGLLLAFILLQKLLQKQRPQDA